MQNTDLTNDLFLFDARQQGKPKIRVVQRGGKELAVHEVVEHHRDKVTGSAVYVRRGEIFVVLPSRRVVFSQTLGLEEPNSLLVKNGYLVFSCGQARLTGGLWLGTAKERLGYLESFDLNMLNLRTMSLNRRPYWRTGIPLEHKGSSLLIAQPVNSRQSALQLRKDASNPLQCRLAKLDLRTNSLRTTTIQIPGLSFWDYWRTNRGAKVKISGGAARLTWK